MQNPAATAGFWICPREPAGSQQKDNVVTNTTNSADVNSSHTSDGAPRSNLMTRDEFLYQVLHSGQLTRIAQHIALVVFLVAEGKNQLKLSLRELEKITGWDHGAIKDHITELEIFMRVTLGTGRAKAIWKLQGVLEDELNKAVVLAARAPKRVERRTPQAVVVPTAPQDIGAQGSTSWSIGAHVPTTSLMAASLIAAVGTTTGVVAAEAPINFDPPAVVVAHVPTKPLVEPWTPQAPSIERESIYTYNNNLSLSTTTLRASEEGEAAEEEDPVQLNGVGIKGPGFKIPYASIDMAAELISMPKETARKIALVCAHEWAANGIKPQSPMSKVKNALMNHHNQGLVQDVKLEKARADAKPKESRAARLLRHVEQAADKEGRS